MFAALSTDENKIADKVNLFVALAPIARMKDVKDTALSTFKGVTVPLVKGMKEFGIYEVYGPEWEENTAFICSVIPAACKNEEKANDPKTKEELKDVTLRVAAGASAKQVLHYLQEIYAGNFAHYDYGKEEN